MQDVVVVALSYLNRIKTSLIDSVPLSLRDSILWLTWGVCVCVRVRAESDTRDSEAIISSDSHLRADTLAQSHTHTETDPQ